MAIYKRGKTWHIDFQSNGQRVRQSANTSDKQKAQELHDKLKSDLWKQARLGDKPRYTWQDAAVRFMRDNTRKSYDTDQSYLIWLDPILGKLYLDQITDDVIDRIIMIKSQEKNRHDKPVKAATVNRLAQFVRTVLNKAKYWHWIDSTPNFNLLTEPKKRIRYLERDEAERLISEAPEHLALMIRFALATGLRQANITGLQWSQVDLERRIAWIHHDQAKAGKAISIPLNNDAVVVLRQCANDSDYVFTYKGQPVQRGNGRAYKKALERAGIKDFTWHDLRHTWASWHVQNGTPLPVLQELGGWADISIVQRYAHLGANHLAEYANNVASFGGNVTKSPQSGNKEKVKTL